MGIGRHPADPVGVHPDDGRRGLRRASEVGDPERQLRGHAPAAALSGPLHRRGGLVAHECIVDLRPITKETGVTVDDVAKRLIDYGFHAPTMSFPVAGTLMIEPTESEDLHELDRFCDAMIAIRAEIGKVGAASGTHDNPLANAPHTAAACSATGTTPTRGRKRRTRPPEPRADKYWSPVRRIDGGYGDRNLMCSCPPLDDYET